MKRFASILLVATFLALGSGALTYVHNLQHEIEDAREDALAKVAGDPIQPHHHDDSNCDLHAQLHLAFMLQTWGPLILCLGLFLGFLRFFNSRQTPDLIPSRLDCRGPPACSC